MSNEQLKMKPLHLPITLKILDNLFHYYLTIAN